MEVVETGERLTLASVYGLWERPVASAESGWIFADASAHRVLSDLSALMGRQDPPPLLVAGDLNILSGYGEHGSTYWKERYQTVFDRARALGLRLVGPQGPRGGQPAAPRPAELPADSANVPTYRTRASDPETATRQLDFVFASDSVATRTRVRALNDDAAWGPSDHCRIAIEIDPEG